MGQGAPETGMYYVPLYVISTHASAMQKVDQNSYIFVLSFFSFYSSLIGTLPGAPSRNFSMNIPEAELEYAPVTGLQELRVKVADYYNHLYRQGKSSQYTPDNVCVSVINLCWMKSHYYRRN